MNIRSYLYYIFLACSICCYGMNSTQNRQYLHDDTLKKEVEASLNQLWNEAYHEQNMKSAKAYEIFMCFVDKTEFKGECDLDVIHKLKSCGLADDKGVIYSEKVEIMRHVPRLSQVILGGMAAEDN